MAPIRIGFIVFAVVFAMAMTFMIISICLSQGTKKLAKKGMSITKKIMQQGKNALEDLTEEMLDESQKRKRKHTKKCPYCDSNIDEDAVKCENCGAQQK